MTAQDRLDVITWVGVSIIAIGLGALIGLAIWYWQVGRK